jgi:MFS family permease
MTSSSPPLDPGARLGLAAMAVAVLVIANDFTALSVAIPSIEKSFAADLTTSQWVINGYALVFGVAIVTGGRLADLYGRRRVFFIGCSLFAASRSWAVRPRASPCSSRRAPSWESGAR